MEGERIVAVGSSDEIRPRIGDATVLDATGLFVMPGFIDAHVHFLDGGRKLSSVQLRDADSPEELARRIGAFAATIPAGTWITGGDWDHQQWGGELPHREMIDRVTPDHPVWVHRLDGHMALANSLALEAAGVTSRHRGGRRRDHRAGRRRSPHRRAQGQRHGSRRPGDAAVDRGGRGPRARRRDGACRGKRRDDGPSNGTFDTLEILRRAHGSGTLRTRVYAAVPLAEWENLAAWIDEKGRGDAWLELGALKGFVDGSLGSHTAAFEAPFDDLPGDRGLLITSEDALYEQVQGADAAGLQVVVHAIGDRANRFLLDVYERVARENGDRDRRFRIEHAQHLRRDDIPRFEDLAVVASMQPYHAIDDGQWAERYIGPMRIRTTYAFKSLLDAGSTVAFGSDWTVAPMSPLEGIHAAVTRRTLDGKNPGGWVPEEKITTEQALRAYTSAAAYAAFHEDERGRIAPGFLADLVILDTDLTTAEPETIRSAAVLRTIVGGRTVYRHPQGAREDE